MGLVTRLPGGPHLDQRSCRCGAGSRNVDVGRLEALAAAGELRDHGGGSG